MKRKHTTLNERWQKSEEGLTWKRNFGWKLTHIRCLTFLNILLPEKGAGCGVEREVTVCSGHTLSVVSSNPCCPTGHLPPSECAQNGPSDSTQIRHVEEGRNFLASFFGPTLVLGAIWVVNR